MSKPSLQHSSRNIDIKQFGLALIGACLAYILAAIFLFFFMDIYPKYAANVQPLLVNGRWQDSAYDSLPVKVFFGFVFITAPVLAYVFSRLSRTSRHFSLLHILGILLLFTPLTWGVGRIVSGNGDNSGLFIIIACIGYLFLLLLMPAKGLLHDVFTILKQKLHDLCMSKAQIASVMMGIVLVGLGWGIFMIAFDKDAPVAGTKIGMILVLMLIGLILAVSQGYDYLKHKLLLSQNAQRIKSILADGFVWLIIALCVFPSDIIEVTTNIFPDPHVILYLLGPALYHAYGTGLVPGLDYYSQYSLGAGPLFTPLIADSLFATYSHYILLAVVFISIFYGILYHLLRGLFNSRIWAFAITFTTLIINFSTKTWLAAPSALPFRYPLLPLFVWFFAKTLANKPQRNNIFLNISTGLIIGLSIVANTETGIFMFFAAIGGYFLFYRFHKSFWLESVLTGVSALVSFILIGFFLFGSGMFTLRFFSGMFEAVLAFGTGFGDFPMVWGELQSVMYNTAAPMVSLATIGWIAATSQNDSKSISPQQYSYLTVFSLLSIFFLLKYLNRSFQQTWLVSSINYIIVIGWWLQYFLKNIFAGHSENRKNNGSGVCGTGYVLASTSLAIFTLLFFTYASINIGEPPVREDAPVGLNAFGYWPSLAKSVFSNYHPSVFENEPRDDADEPTQGNIDFITAFTNHGDRISVFTDNDFAYYYAAQRAHQFGFIPGKWTLFNYYIDKWIAEKASPVFVESVPELIVPEVNSVLMANYLSYRSPTDGKLSVFLLFEHGDEITFKPAAPSGINNDPHFEPGKLHATKNILMESFQQGYVIHYTTSTGTFTHLNRGPFVDLPQGQYKVIYWLRIGDNTLNKPAIRLSVTSGESKLKESEISAHEFQSSDNYFPFTITINLPARLEEIEFLVTPLAKTDIWVQKITITRVAQED